MWIWIIFLYAFFDVCHVIVGPDLVSLKKYLSLFFRFVYKQVGLTSCRATISKSVSLSFNLSIRNFIRTSKFLLILNNRIPLKDFPIFLRLLNIFQSTIGKKLNGSYQMFKVATLRLGNWVLLCFVIFFDRSLFNFRYLKFFFILILNE